MLALDPRVVGAVGLVRPRIPVRAVDDHPLGCHRHRIPDRDCFEAILFRLVTGCSWDVAGRLGKGGETTLRARRDEWVRRDLRRFRRRGTLGFDKVIGLDLSEVAVDGSMHKAPSGGEGTGRSPVDRGKTGWKWSVATDTKGIPIGWVTAAANRNDCVLLPGDSRRGCRTRPLIDVETLHLDRGYDKGVVRAECTRRGVTDLVIAERRKPRHRRTPTTVPSVFGGPSSGPTHGSPTSVSCAATPTGSSCTAWLSWPWPSP